MWRSLKTKNKHGFVDGSIPKPAADDPLFGVWDRCNTLVISWLTQAMDPVIAQSILWMDLASEIWADLKSRYYQGDLFRISDLQKDLYSLKQGDMPITTYFTRLKSLWQEFEAFRPIPSCTCAVSCTCDLIPIVKSYRDSDYVIRFLKGLHENYAAVRSSIMLMDPLPPISKVFSLLVQQERQFKSVNLEESKILAYHSDAGKKYAPNVDHDSHEQNRSKRTSYPSKGKGNSGRYAAKECSFCLRSGHTVDYCYKKYGYPPISRRMGVLIVLLKKMVMILMLNQLVLLSLKLIIQHWGLLLSNRRLYWL
ncbi:uncharacterized protein LOC130709610 [Lotus japonicus]|uniref:uncharacterized protein LOC130709610 n=1 Tax=Lotus japonicus TaxID=34305 RepID=UPI002583F593|nr:uncharacterized protein LOC130709610 [Lotus japonicus]